jgi:hypothetical protein
MALWGLNDNIQTFGTVAVSGNTVTGTGTTFTTDVEVGQVIRVGTRGGVGTYYGDAVISGITSDRILTIDSTAGLSAVSIAATAYGISELPMYTVKDSVYQEERSEADSLVYGISTDTAGQYGVAHHGWVGVTTYMDMHGNLRVKSEVLVAQSGIQTGANGIAYPTDE